MLEQIAIVRKEEVHCLREHLKSLLEEANHYRTRIKDLESHLYMLSMKVIEGELEDAREIAKKSLNLVLKEGDNEN